MLNTSKKLPELLAPAGNPECALAAFDAGADAVYAGLAKFNARERGKNFTPEMLKKIVDYAHSLGKKVFVTFNTLVKETELPEVMEQLALLSDIAPDALLVQDLGVVRLARTYFPQLVLHGSTQMGIHNTAGFRFAEALGLSRVVLERQVTLEELTEIRRHTKLEIEVFIHGALCAAMSGSCFFSSFLGGASGNRGKCKQPCRRRYFSTQGNGFFFSPQDLCTLEMIPEFTRLGVTSLKIEGRLRQPDYVTSAVRAYRMMLDAPEEKFAETLKEARNVLSSACGRRWSNGFYTADNFEKLILPDALGASGVRCGSVEATRANGFGFTATRRVHLGDRLRIQPRSGDEGPALTITKMFVHNLPAKYAVPGDRVFVCCDKPVPLQGVVFKIGGSFADYSGRLEALPERKISLDLSVSINANSITANLVGKKIPQFSAPLNLQPAEKHPANAEKFLKEFSGCAVTTPYRIGTFDFHIDGDYFIPASEIKGVARNFWRHVTENLPPQVAAISDTGAALNKFHRDYLEIVPATVAEHLRETVALKIHGAEPADRHAIRSNNIYEINRETGEASLPAFCPENRLRNLSDAIARALAAGVNRFRVTSLYGLQLLNELLPPDTEAEIMISTPLPVCNSQAVMLLREFGASRCMAHIEMERSSIEALRQHSVLPLELYRLGRPALLTTRAKLPVEGEVHDLRKTAFEVRFDRRDGLTRIYPKLPISVPRLPGIYDFYDLTNATWRATDSCDFNFSGDWL